MSQNRAPPKWVVFLWCAFKPTPKKRTPSKHTHTHTPKKKRTPSNNDRPNMPFSQSRAHVHQVQAGMDGHQPNRAGRAEGGALHHASRPSDPRVDALGDPPPLLLVDFDGLFLGLDPSIPPPLFQMCLISLSITNHLPTLLFFWWMSVDSSWDRPPFWFASKVPLSFRCV